MPEIPPYIAAMTADPFGSRAFMDENGIPYGASQRRPVGASTPQAGGPPMGPGQAPGLVQAISAMLAPLMQPQISPQVTEHKLIDPSSQFAQDAKTNAFFGGPLQGQSAGERYNAMANHTGAYAPNMADWGGQYLKPELAQGSNATAYMGDQTFHGPKGASTYAPPVKRAPGPNMIGSPEELAMLAHMKKQNPGYKPTF